MPDSRTKYARVIGYKGARVRYDRVNKHAKAYNHSAKFWESALMCPNEQTGQGAAPPQPTHTKKQISGKGGGGYARTISTAKGKKDKTASGRGGGPDSIHIFCSDPEQGGT
jgi:hypothetical protein